MKLLNVVVLFATVALGAEPENFKMRAPLSGDFGDQAVLRVKLTPDIIAKTHRHYDDVRLISDKNEETPYVVYEEQAPELPATVFSFAPKSFDQKDGTTTIVFEREGSGPFDELEFSLAARDFNKSIRLQTAPTATGPWTGLVSDSLFDFSAHLELRKTSVTVPEVDAKFLRAELSDVKPEEGDGSGFQLKYGGAEIKVDGKGKAPAEFRITGVSARLTRVRGTVAARETMVLNHQSASLDEAKSSVIDLGEVAMPLTRVALDVATPFFFRRFEAWGGNKASELTLVASGSVYRVPGMKDAETSLNLRGLQERFLRLKIVNGDNPPLVITAIRGEWTPVYLYFIGAQGRGYSLYYSAEDTRAPNYDLGTVLPATSLGKVAVKDLTLGVVAENPGYKMPAPPDTTKEGRERIFFTIAILCAVGLMGFWIFRLVGKVSSTLQ